MQDNVIQVDLSELEADLSLIVKKKLEDNFIWDRMPGVIGWVPPKKDIDSKPVGRPRKHKDNEKKL